MPPNPFRMRRPLGVPGSANQATDASPAPSVHTAREDNTPSRSGSVNLGARASSIRPRGISHGSVEQSPRDVFGRTTQSPQRPQTPRRARSPEADARSHSRDRDRRRQERRGLFQDSPPAGEPPQGFGSRLLTVESNIKDCVREIPSLKSTIGEISGHFETIQKAKFELDAKLDKTFGDWNERIAASEKNSTTLLDVASSNMANAFDRIQKLEFEVLKLVGRAPDDQQPRNAPTSNNFGSPLSGGPQWASAGPNVAGDRPLANRELDRRQPVPRAHLDLMSMLGLLLETLPRLLGDLLLERALLQHGRPHLQHLLLRVLGALHPNLCPRLLLDQRHLQCRKMRAHGRLPEPVRT